MLEGEDNASIPHDLRAVSPEKLIDIEAGVEVRRGPTRLVAGFYAMEFRDEIALSGELSEIGLPVRRNVPRSYRRGFEVEFNWQPNQEWNVLGNANLSRNRIAEWKQYYDVYDTSGSWVESIPIVHYDVPHLLTPEVLLNGWVDWRPRPEIGLGLGAHWAAESQLDNSGNPDFRTPSWFNLDATVTFFLERWVKQGAPKIRVQATNLLGNRRIWPSGYSYLYFQRNVAGPDAFQGISYYYPLATRSVYLTLDVSF
jgi:iron complex outermembrane receptor protein